MRLSLDLGVSLGIDMNAPFARSPNAARDALCRVHRQFFRVVAFSFFPEHQSNGRDLPRHRQQYKVSVSTVRHLRSKVRPPGSPCGGDGGALENVLQHPIAVLIHPAQSRPLLRSAYAALNQLVLRADTRYKSEAGVLPELPLASKPMRRGGKGKDQRAANGSNARNTPQDLGRRVLPCLGHHVRLRFRTQRLKSIELAPEFPNSQRHPSAFELIHPVLPLLGRIDSTARAIDPPRSENRLESVLGSRAVCYDRSVALRELLQISRALLAVVDGRQGIRAQQLRQPLRIRLVRFVAVGRDLPRIAYNNLGDVRLDQIVEPGRLCSLFKRDPERSSLALEEVQDGRGFRLNNRLGHNLPKPIQHRDHGRCSVHIHPDTLCLFHEALLLWFGFRTQRNPTIGGAP